MNTNFLSRISNDLNESQITLSVVLLMIPIAFFTYLFHELGHWTLGELMGNDMTISLNNSAPRSGYFIKKSHSLWSAIGGPLFTILQALLFLIVAKRTKSIYAYSFIFMAVFSRFFSIVFGGISLQDESRIASMLNVNEYLVASIVLIILAILLWVSSRIMELNLKAIGYFTTFSTFAILLVIGLNELINNTQVV
jgi:hypothetical protein